MDHSKYEVTFDWSDWTIGSSILNALRSSGYEVTCAVRNIAKAQALAGPNVILHKLDQSLDFQT